MRLMADRWFPVLQGRVHEPRVRLVCFPAIAAGTSAFVPWSRDMPPYVEVRCLRLPGTESRINEEPCGDLAAFREQAGAALAELPALTTVWAAHCSGAILALEVLRGFLGPAPRPEHLWVYGQAAPRLFAEANVASAGSGSVWDVLAEVGPLPIEVMEHAELRDILEDSIRAQLNLFHNFEAAGQPVHVPATVAAGRDDPVLNAQDLVAWSEVFTSARLLSVEGTHLLPGSVDEFCQQLRDYIVVLASAGRGTDRA